MAIPNNAPTPDRLVLGIDVGTDLQQEAALADAYWRRYGDVAADSVVGRDGALGVFGAREHYNRHGRRENRIWGETKK